MLKSGKEYLESLRDGRRVYIGNELVEDVTEHVAFRNAAKSFSLIYELKASPENRDVMSFEENGDRFSTYFLMPKTDEDLKKRMETHRRIAEWSHGLLGRSPDHVSSFVTGLAMKPEMFEEIGQGYGANIVNYYKYMRANDIFACYTVLPPQGARKPELYEREGMTVPTLHVSDEDDNGVTLNGMKMLGTSAIFSNETWVGNLLPLAPNQEKESITCAVPLNEGGISIWSRKPLEKYAVTEFDNPLSWRFDESDAMVVFEDVKVPWEKVFVHDNPEMSRGIYVKSPSHSMGNHQSNIRFLEKLKLIVGIAHKIVEANGVGHIPAVQGILGELAAQQAALEAIIQGQLNQPEKLVDGYLNINRRYMYAALHWCTTNYSKICDVIRDLMGGGPFQMPADISVIESPEMKRTFEKYWSVPGQTAIDRMKLYKLAWDLIGSEFAGRHLQYERFYAGPSFVVTNYSYLNAPWDSFGGLVDDILDSY
ncbi:MAG: 4-hydroxyphenylacetate 3-hydroxylase N-terminal domain-containing protein [Pseudomonadota bacterium]|nr:4-hydroxyphenylacetate 3-hydroxylase N-terminal domain-containing protein [Pseudomonadota bacterium]